MTDNQHKTAVRCQLALIGALVTEVLRQGGVFGSLGSGVPPLLATGLLIFATMVLYWFIRAIVGIQFFFFIAGILALLMFFGEWPFPKYAFVNVSQIPLPGWEAPTIKRASSEETTPTPVDGPVQWNIWTITDWEAKGASDD